MSKSCGDCIHYQVCHVARSFRTVYHSLRGGEIDVDHYDKLIAWAKEFAQYCRLYEGAEK